MSYKVRNQLAVIDYLKYAKFNVFPALNIKGKVWFIIVSYTLIDKIDDFQKWEPILNNWGNSHKFFIPQHFPIWFKVFEGLRSKLNFSIIIAHDDYKIIDLLSFSIFDGNYGRVIHSNPYIGYGGFVSKDSEVWRGILDKLEQVAIDKECVTITICTPPFQEDQIDEYIKSFNPNYCIENFYQYSDIEQHPLEKLNSKKKAKFKNIIKKGVLNGITLSLEYNLDRWEQWYDIYHKRLMELGAEPFSKELFLNVYKELVPLKMGKLFCAYKHDQLIGGTLILLGHNVADYFVSAFNKDYLELSANDVVLDSIFNWLTEHNYNVFNWESSPGKEGVYRYKKKWGGIEGKHFYMTKVIGNDTKLLNENIELVKKEYKGIYILPYYLWKEV